MSKYRIFYKDAPYICSTVITATSRSAAIEQFKSEIGKTITAIMAA